MHIAPNTDTVPASVNWYLLPHERQVITVHFHPAILLWPVGAAVAGLIAAIVASAMSVFSSNALLIIWLGWVLLVLYAIGRTLRWTVDYFVVTSYRLLVVKGVVTRDVVSIPLIWAADVRFRRSALGRVLGYGQYVIRGDQTHPPWKVNYMPYPEQLYLEMMGLIFREEDPGRYASGHPEQPGDEVDPEHDGRDEDEERGP